MRIACSTRPREPHTFLAHLDAACWPCSWLQLDSLEWAGLSQEAEATGLKLLRHVVPIQEPGCSVFAVIWRVAIGAWLVLHGSCLLIGPLCMIERAIFCSAGLPCGHAGCAGGGAAADSDAETKTETEKVEAKKVTWLSLNLSISPAGSCFTYKDGDRERQPFFF